MQAFTENGVWWLPGQQTQTAGTLSYSPDEGLRLTLIGSLIEEPHPEEVYPIVAGLLAKGGYVTLLDTRVNYQGMAAPGFIRQTFRASTAIVGALIEKADQLVFDDITVEYNYFAQWLKQSGIHINPTIGDEGTLVRYDVSWQRPPEYETKHQDVTITYAYRFNGEPGKDSITIRQQSVIRMQSATKRALEQWFHQYVAPLQNFLSLATSRPNHLSELTVAVPRSDEDEGRPPIRARVYIERVYYDPREVKTLLPSDVLFLFSDITENHDQILLRWLRVNQELSDMCNLFFGAQYRPSGYRETRFLILAQATEIYHRIRGRKTVLPRDVFEARKRMALRHLRGALRKWTETLFNYANEPRLRDRIEDLMDLTADVMMPLIGDRNAFVRKVAHTRNYFTHYTVSLRKKVVIGRDLYWLTEALAILLERCLLHELGFTSEQCVVLFQRRSYYQFVQKQISKGAL